MEENKELQEENLNATEQETQQTEKNVAENVTKEPTTEELLAEEKGQLKSISNFSSLARSKK